MRVVLKSRSGHTKYLLWFEFGLLIRILQTLVFILCVVFPFMLARFKKSLYLIHVLIQTFGSRHLHNAAYVNSFNITSYPTVPTTTTLIGTDISLNLPKLNQGSVFAVIERNHMVSHYGIWRVVMILCYQLQTCGLASCVCLYVSIRSGQYSFKNISWYFKKSLQEKKILNVLLILAGCKQQHL